MAPIPDTGGGISGFVAWLLWHVYRHFPFSGTWDWLVLCIGLAVLAPVLFLPYLWMAAQRVRQYDESRKRSDLGLGGAPAWALASTLWDGVWIALWFSFFCTPAGQTLLEGRRLFGVPSPGLVDLDGPDWWFIVGLLFSSFTGTFLFATMPGGELSSMPLRKKHLCAYLGTCGFVRGIITAFAPVVGSFAPLSVAALTLALAFSLMTFLQALLFFVVYKWQDFWQRKSADSKRPRSPDDKQKRLRFN